MNFEENIKKNNIILPKAPDPVGSYVATKVVGNLLYISGQISIDDAGNLIKGKLGKELDVEKYIRQKLIQRDPDEIGRVEMELDMYRERGLFPVLQLLIWIVDTMRKHNLVWGVGRGSSVSSYLLYILGVHKVDSYKYGLDIKEFLR